MQYRIDITGLADGNSRGFLLGETPGFVVLKDGQAYAYRNQCPHLGIELEWEPDKFLDFEGVMIQCATHGALFLIENGECVSGPCLGKSLLPLPCHREGNTLVVETMP